VYAVWNNTNGDGTDVSSPDLGGSTANFVWKVQVSGGSVELACAIGGGTWTILVSTRIIF
jgi:hypothetical protein